MNQSGCSRGQRCGILGLLGACAALVALAAAPRVVGAETADVEYHASLDWRSESLPGGETVLFGDLSRLLATTRGFYAFDFQTEEVVHVSTDGRVSERESVVGESPGHAWVPADVDIDPHGEGMVLVQALMPARVVLREPVSPPFESVVTVSLPEPEGRLRLGVSARLQPDWVAVLVTEQPMSDLNVVEAKIFVVSRSTGAANCVYTRQGRKIIGQNVAAYWEWALSPDGHVYLSPDHNSLDVLRVSPDGGTIESIEVPVSVVRKPGEMIERVRESYREMAKFSSEEDLVVEENYRAITMLSSGDGQVFVVGSDGIGRGASQVSEIVLFEIDEFDGTPPTRSRIVLPFALSRVQKASFDGERLYLLADAVDSADFQEVYSFSIEPPLAAWEPGGSP